MNRRQLIGRSAAFASAFTVGRHLPRAAESYPFTLGVASGEPAQDGFVLWTRLAPTPLALDGQGGSLEPVTVMWEAAEDDAIRNVVRTGTARADRRSAHSVHAEVGSLEPGRDYWYRFTALGERSVIGRAKTAPAVHARPESMRFAFASCSNWQSGYFSAYRHMAEENPDLVLFLGDYIYESTFTGPGTEKVVRKHDGPTTTDLAGYRNRYALYRTDPDLQALHAAAPCLMTWDDHEVENDYANEWSERMEISPEDFLQRRAAAYQAYYEHMPLRARSVPRSSTLRLYDQFRFGDLVTFWVLDGRQYRSKQPCEIPPSRRGHMAPDSCKERLDAGRSLLGTEQERWLFDGLGRSDTAWNIAAQEQLVAQLRRRDGTGVSEFWTDGWDAFPAARQHMLEAISAARVPNPVFIGGDIHSFWVTDLKLDFDNPSSATVATEFVGTSITSDPPPYELVIELLSQNPHVRYFESRYRGYVAMALFRDRLEARLRVISDRSDPKATVSTLKQFVVESGKPGAVSV